jgi:hypothetical protein
VGALRWILILNLLLSGLLSLQQPSVLVRGDRWIQASPMQDARTASDGQLLEEEEELHAVHATERVRRKTLLSWRPGNLPARPIRSSETDLSPRGGDSAGAHWRAALLPPRSPLEDEHLATA